MFGLPRLENRRQDSLQVEHPMGGSSPFILTFFNKKKHEDKQKKL